MAKKQTTARRRRARKVVEKGIAHIHSTFNNTIVTITDMQGNVISWNSAGALGFKGSSKSRAFVAQMDSEAVANVASEKSMKNIEVTVKGDVAGRDAVVRSQQEAGLEV